MRTFARVSLLCVFAAFLAFGCGSTEQTARGIPEGSSAVLGVWKYRTQGSAFLAEGTLRITVENGRLTGALRDSRIGHANARVDYRDTHLEIRVDDLHVDGRVENDKLVGFVRRPMWDVSTSQDAGAFSPAQRRSLRTQRHTRDGSAPIVARRVQNLGVAMPHLPLGCTGGPTESDYTCR